MTKLHKAIAGVFAASLLAAAPLQSAAAAPLSGESVKSALELALDFVAFLFAGGPIPSRVEPDAGRAHVPQADSAKDCGGATNVSSGQSDVQDLVFLIGPEPMLFAI